MIFSRCLAVVFATTVSAADPSIAQQLQAAAQGPGAPAPADDGYGAPKQNNVPGYGSVTSATPSGPAPAPPPVPPPAPPPAATPAQPPPTGGRYPTQGQPSTVSQALGAQQPPPQQASTGSSSLQFDESAQRTSLEGQAAAPQGQQQGGFVSPASPSPSNTQGQFGGGSPGQGAPANPMGALLGAVMGQQQGGGSFSQGGVQNAPLVVNGKVNSAVLSADSQQVVDGLITSFMHNYQLQPGEKACLQNNVAGLTGSIMGVIGDAAIAIKSLIAGKGTIQKNAQGDVVSAGMDSAMKITSLVGSATGLAKGCVHGDALEMLKTTAKHMIDGKWLQERFIVSGVDIVGNLADSVDAFEDHNFRKFGSDIGTALRKVLLSKSTSATRLPDSVPNEVIIQDTTEGFMSGFFVSGETLEITDSARPDVDIRVNLHECVAGNADFFKEIWLALWNVIARLSAHTLGADMQNMFAQKGGGQPKWAGELMIAMMQFPSALQKCGLNMGMQHMLMEAIQTLGNLQIHFTFPQDQIQAGKATDEMAEAVTAWTRWNFKLFGRKLGLVFRQLVMLAFPQKYSVDASGRLQAKLERPEKASSPVMIVAGASISMLVAFALVRTRRSIPQELPENMVAMRDVEDGEEVE